jgi:hypothetical protein
MSFIDRSREKPTPWGGSGGRDPQHAANEREEVLDRLELAAFARYDVLDAPAAALAFSTIPIGVEVDDERAMDRKLGRGPSIPARCAHVANLRLTPMVSRVEGGNPEAILKLS